MATTFKVPSSPARSLCNINSFLGCDFTNSPAAVSESMSPNCVNMIRDVPGKVRKCMGYQTQETYTDKINGYHQLQDAEYPVVHSGTKMYVNNVVVYEGAADARSKSFQLNNKMYIIDGKKMLVYDGETLSPASSVSYIPTLTIAKEPSGGGTQYEALNLIQPGFTEKFQGTETDKEYQLTFGNLDTTTVEVKIMDENGDFVVLKK